LANPDILDSFEHVHEKHPGKPKKNALEQIVDKLKSADQSHGQPMCEIARIEMIAGGWSLALRSRVGRPLYGHFSRGKKKA